MCGCKLQTGGFSSAATEPTLQAPPPNNPPEPWISFLICKVLIFFLILKKSAEIGDASEPPKPGSGPTIKDRKGLAASCLSRGGW